MAEDFVESEHEILVILNSRERKSGVVIWSELCEQDEVKDIPPPPRTIVEVYRTLERMEKRDIVVEEHDILSADEQIRTHMNIMFFYRLTPHGEKEKHKFLLAREKGTKKTAA